MNALLDLGKLYLITFGWAIVGSLSMSVGVVIALKMFTWCTKEVDEWALIKQGNMAMATVLAALILSLGLVVGLVIKAQ